MQGTRFSAALLAILLGGCASNGDKAHDPETQALIDDSLREFCAMPRELPCREEVVIELRVDETGNTETFEFELLPPPLQQGYLSLLSGETVYLTGEFRDGTLVNTRAAFRPFRTPHLKFAFSQDENGQAMRLAVHSTFENTIKYKLAMMRPDSGELMKTSSCPVIANRAAFELWPQAIFQLIVLEVRELGAGEPMVCAW